MLNCAMEEAEVMRSPSAPAFKAVRPTNATYALGLAVRVLSKYAAFARLDFGEWTATLAGQIDRGQYLFVLKENEVEGLAGWAFADRDLAQAWLEGEADVPHEQCFDGDCVILNVWQTNSKSSHRFLLNHLRGLFSEKDMLVAKRIYSDGRVRPIKITNNGFISRHLAEHR